MDFGFSVKGAGHETTQAHSMIAHLEARISSHMLEARVIHTELILFYTHFKNYQLRTKIEVLVKKIVILDS